MISLNFFLGLPIIWREAAIRTLGGITEISNRQSACVLLPFLISD